MILVDSSFLYAWYDTDDRDHSRVMPITETNHGLFIVPNVVLTETAFLFWRNGGLFAVTNFLQDLRAGQPPLEAVTYDTLQRARDIMIAYHDSRFDFVDCCIMALAEHIQITQIGTLDRRDFLIYRPLH
jgi:predicted nucleic acid-binding protein